MCCEHCAPGKTSTAVAEFTTSSGNEETRLQITRSGPAVLRVTLLSHAGHFIDHLIPDDYLLDAIRDLGVLRGSDLADVSRGVLRETQKQTQMLQEQQRLSNSEMAQLSRTIGALIDVMRLDNERDIGLARVTPAELFDELLNIGNIGAPGFKSDGTGPSDARYGYAYANGERVAFRADGTIDITSDIASDIASEL